MLKTLFRYRTLLVLMVLAVLLKLFSLQPAWVEAAYTAGVYLALSKSMRFLFGWLPFSMGDLVYGAAGVLLFLFVWKVVKAVRIKGSKNRLRRLFYNAVCTIIVVSILFNVLWGLNYNRLGIAHQLALQVQPYGLPEATQLAQALQARLNNVAEQVDTTKRKELLNDTQLFQKVILVYRDAAARFPFLRYQMPSIKPSLYSGVGHYFGFTGYYNPFTGEAQLKTGIPVFLKPFVATHEIAHQLGYAKENEANFVAFLAVQQCKDAEFLYSLYFNLYGYAIREVYNRDTVLAMGFRKTLHPQVLRDNEVLKAYFRSTENQIEPLVTRFYDQYLKWNNQKAGVQSYNQVVALLIAYGKKYGWQAL